MLFLQDVRDQAFNSQMSLVMHILSFQRKINIAFSDTFGQKTGFVKTFFITIKDDEIVTICAEVYCLSRNCGSHVSRYENSYWYWGNFLLSFKSNLDEPESLNYVILNSGLQCN